MSRRQRPGHRISAQLLAREAREQGRAQREADRQERDEKIKALQAEAENIKVKSEPTMRLCRTQRRLS